MAGEDVFATIQARFPGTTLACDTGQGEWMLSLAPSSLGRACEFLRDEPESRCDLLLLLTAAQGEAYYQLASTQRCQRLRLHVPIDPSAPIDSLAFTWPAANWEERQAHGLWEIAFRGHPELRPLFRPAALAGDDTPPAEDALPRIGSRYPTSVEGWPVHLELDGGRVIRAQPDLGYRRCGIEQRLTQWPYVRGTLLAARIDGFAAMNGDLAYALAVEKLLQIQVPLRAEYLRTIYAEMQRISSHLAWLIRCTQRTSDPGWAAPSCAWEARRAILDLFQWLGGNPITPDLVSIGGLRCDTPQGFVPAVQAVLDGLKGHLVDLAILVDQSAAFRARLEDVGIIDPGTALGLGMTGPNLRGSGRGYDVRTSFPYAAYQWLDIEVPTGQRGDALARYRVRMREIRASMDLIGQALRDLPGGPVNAWAVSPLANPDEAPLLPTGTVYASVEGPRGELGVCLVVDGSGRLCHAHIRGPSLANLSALPLMCQRVANPGGMACDRVDQILDSLDISIGEVER
jgi:NADH-quinone oxidoreductase subunit D